MGALTLGVSVADAVELATMAFFVVFRLLSKDFFWMVIVSSS